MEPRRCLPLSLASANMIVNLELNLDRSHALKKSKCDDGRKGQPVLVPMLCKGARPHWAVEGSPEVPSALGHRRLLLAGETCDQDEELRLQVLLRSFLQERC